MGRTLRRLFVGFLILAALAAIAYQSRHKIHLADFTWRKFIQSGGDANVWYLLLAILGIYGCYAIRALRWQRFCRYLGPSGFWGTYSSTLMGFAAIFVLGRAGEPVRPLLLARKNRQPVSGMFGIFFLERGIRFRLGGRPDLPELAGLSQGAVGCWCGHKLGRRRAPGRLAAFRRIARRW